jgi:hypothetical protein
MTTATSKRVAVQVSGHPEVRSLTLSWVIPGGLPGAPGGAASLELALSVEDGTASAALLAGEQRAELARGCATIIFDGQTGLWHADASDLLAASWRIDRSGRVQVLYAATPLLGRVGVPGGRYDLRAQAQ